MAWRAPFLAALEQRASAIAYLLEVIEVHEEPGAAFVVASHAGLGGSTKVWIGSPDGAGCVRVEGSSLTPRSWSTTIGAFSVNLVGDLAEFCRYATRGSVVQLKAGFAGMSPADFEPIAVGQVRNIRGTAPMWTVECHDILTALQQRLTADYAASYLFNNVWVATTLANPWTVGVSTSIEVVSTANFDRETGGTGAVRVTPSGGGAPFILLYTGTATGPTRFTGSTTVGVLGTTASSASAGDAVKELLYLTGHPLNLVRKLLCSRDGTNGTYDTLPSGSGLALFDALVDHDDIDRFRDTVVVTSSGSYSWSLVVDAEQSDALSWLSSYFLAPAGLFLATRQGLVTVRAAQDSQTAAYHSGIEITDADIAEVVSYEAFDYQHLPEYARVRVATGGSANTSASANFATLPAAGSLEYSLADRVWTNEAAIQDDAIARLHESAARVPERLVLKCAGRRLAQLTIGDVVDLSTKLVHSRRDGAEGFEARRAIVDAVSPDWDGTSVEIGLLVYPESEDAFA